MSYIRALAGATVIQRRSQKVHISIPFRSQVVSPKEPDKLTRLIRWTEPLIPIVQSVFGMLGDQNGWIERVTSVTRGEQPCGMPTGPGIVEFFEALKCIRD